MNINAIIITREYWENSPLSIARHYGGIKINGVMYGIMDRVHGDLVREDWIQIYQKLGRDKVLELINNGIPLLEAKKLLKHKNKKYGETESLLRLGQDR